MGRQINFWMTAADEQEFVDRLQRDDAVWVPYANELNARPQPRELDEFVPDGSGDRFVFVRRGDAKRIRFNDVAVDPFEGAEWRRTEFRAWTRVDTSSTPGFEWNTCLRADGVIERGRIYCPASTYVGPMYERIQDAVKWFARLQGWIRRRGESHADNERHYVLPGALAAVRDGQSLR